MSKGDTALSATSTDVVLPEAFYQSTDNGDWALEIERALAHAVPLKRAVTLNRLYTIKTPIDLIDGSVIIGGGVGTDLVAPTNLPITLINYMNRANITLSNFEIDGGMTAALTTKSFSRGVSIHDSTNVRITDLHVKNTADWVISFMRCTLVTVFRHTHTGGGLRLPGGLDALHFIDCSDVLVDGASSDSGDDCVAVTSETVGNSRITFRNIIGRSDIGSVEVSN